MEIDWSHDENRLVHPGPMMGIDRVRFHQLIGMDWAQNQSKIEIKLILSFDKDQKGITNSLQYLS